MYTENYNIGLYFVLYKKDNNETFLNTKERPITEHHISFGSTKNLPQGCVANHKTWETRDFGASSFMLIDNQLKELFFFFFIRQSSGRGFKIVSNRYQVS